MHFKPTTVAMILSMLSLSACSATQSSTESHAEAAKRITQQNIIVDGHIDVPYRVQNQWVDVTKSTSGGDFDYPRAVEGGLNAPFMSIYVPASLDDSAESTALAHRLIDYVEAIVGRAPRPIALKMLRKTF